MALTGFVSDWSCEDVKLWLHNNNLREAASTFEEHDIDGSVLLELSEEDLRRPPVSMLKLGTIKRLSKLISDLRRLHLGSSGDSPFKRTPEPERWNRRANRFGRDVTDGKSRSNVLKPEIGKAVLSFLYCFTVFFITAFVMAVCHRRVPDMKRYPPLPDLALDNIPFIPWAFALAELCGGLLAVIWVGILLFHQHRFILLRRMFCITGTVFLLRACTMLLTSLSVPNAHFHCSPQNQSVSEHAQQILFGCGLSVQGVRTCGDYMFSGHTSILTMLNFLITECQAAGVVSLPVLDVVENCDFKTKAYSS